MASFKSSYARLARMFEQSRDKWRGKAVERHKRIRALEVKVRDLEKSRALWKSRALDQENRDTSSSDEDLKDTSEHELVEAKDENERSYELVEAKGDDERLVPYNHQYSLLMISLSIELQLMYISLRGTCRVLELFNWALQEDQPTFPCVQNWACRYGLYLLNEPKEYRKDWVFVVDHTVGQGKNKCLVILGISEEDLERVSYSPSHGDMQVLRLEVTELGTGEALFASLENLSMEVGTPTQIVADHGSDVCKGIALFQERHPETIYTYDISHRMAIFLKQEFSNDPCWNDFFSQCGRSIPKFQQTNLSFLCPPPQRIKARFMQTHHQIGWGQNLLNYYDKADFSLIDTQCILSLEVWRVLRNQFGIPAVLSLLPQLGKSYSNQENFREILVKSLGDERVNLIPDSLWQQADAGRQRFLEGFEWLLGSRQDLEIYGKILDWSHSVQKQLKSEGLSQKSRQTIKESFDALCCQEPKLQRLAKKTLDYLLEETKDFPDGKIALASSDIIESVFGSYKVYTEKGPLKEIGKLVLMIPVLVNGVCKEKLRKAMETVPTRNVKKWLDENCGPSMMAKRRIAFSS